MKHFSVRYLLQASLLLLPAILGAQPTLEFSSNSASTTAIGSSTSAQTVTFYNNTNNPTGNSFSAYTPTTTATFTLSNQQYTLPVTQNLNGADVSFGATSTSGAQLISSFQIFPQMNAVSGASASDFSSSPTAGTAGTGMSMNSNYGVEIFNSAMGLYNANAVTNGTYYMANLMITFNQPVSNPVLQIVGLGGTYSVGPSTLGFTSQLTLLTSGVTMSMLSGSPELSVTSTQILNTATNPTATTGSGAASGSVLVSGTNITSLSFKIYMRGDGGYSSWGGLTLHTGDAFLVGVSLLSTVVNLPVTIGSFTAQPENDQTLLQWTTLMEENTAYFSVEYSHDSLQWEQVGTVVAAGNSSTPKNYQFIHAAPAPGNDFYRIVEYDLDGQPNYSQIREVSFAGKSVTNFYPNPTINMVTITTADGAPRSVQLLNMSGQVLQMIPQLNSGGSIDLSRYAAGIYLLVVRDAAGGQETTRILKR